MPRKKPIPTRFSTRLTRANAVLIQDLVDYGPTVSSRNEGVNYMIGRYFLYVKYEDLIRALEKPFKRGQDQT